MDRWRRMDRAKGKVRLADEIKKVEQVRILTEQ